MKIPAFLLRRSLRSNLQKVYAAWWTGARSVTTTTIATVAMATTVAGAPALAYAQTQGQWPDHPIRIIVTVPAGGAQDIQARINAKILTDALGVGVVVENKPGGSGILGANYVAHAKPDGYTLLAGTIGPVVADPSLYKSLPYQSPHDFAPITIAANYPLVVLVSKTSPYKTFAELVAAAKAHPNTISLGLIRGTSPHFLLEKLREQTGAQFLYVPYAGGAAPVTDVIAGHLCVYLTNTTGFVPLIQDGQIRALAVEGKTRSRTIPEVPTLTEAGFPNVEINGGWQALLAPAGTPPAIINRIHQILVKGLNAPAVKKGIEDNGGYLVLNSPAEFATYLKTEVPLIADLARKAGIEPQ